MIRKIGKWLQKWYIQFFLVLIPIVLGCIGYGHYYSVIDQRPPAWFWTIFSTLRLFVLSFDANAAKYDGKFDIYWYLLTAAQFIAPVVTVHSVLKLLMPKLLPLIAQFKYWKWRYWKKGNKNPKVG